MKKFTHIFLILLLTLSSNYIKAQSLKLISPDSAKVSVTNPIMFKWWNSGQGMSQQLVVYNGPDTILNIQITYDLSNFTELAFKPNTTYNWYVYDNDFSVKSTEWKFTTGSDLLVPSAPLPIGPDSVSILSLKIIQPRWELYNMYDSVRIQISEFSNFSSTTYIGTQTYRYDNYLQIPSSKLKANTTFYWRAMAFMNKKQSLFSETWKFKTDSGFLAPFYSFSPADSSTNNTLDNSLYFYNDGAPEFYNIQISKSPFDSTKLIVDTLITAFDYSPSYFYLNPQKMDTNTWYSWRALVAKPYKLTSPAPILNFKTGNIPALPAPPDYFSFLPGDPYSTIDTIPTKPTFTWSNTKEATAYHILVISSLGDTVINKIVNKNSYKPVLDSLKYLTQYSWSVSSINKWGEGSFSQSINIITKRDPTSVPEMPTMNSYYTPSKNYNYDLYLSTQYYDATEYYVNINTDSAYNGTTIFADTIVNDYLTVTLKYNRNNYIKIVAINKNGSSIPFETVINPGAPPATNVLFPKDSTTVKYNTPKLIVEKQAGIEYYRIQIISDTILSMYPDSFLVDTIVTSEIFNVPASAGLKNKYTYNWRVATKADTIFSTFSSYGVFKVDSNGTTLAPPTITLLPDTFDYNSGVYEFNWQSPMGYYYFIWELSKTPQFDSIIVRDTVDYPYRFIKYGDFISDMTHYWRVGVVNDFGISYSTVDTFYYKDVLLKPILITPANGQFFASNDLVSLSYLGFNERNNGTGHTFKISDKADMSNVVYSDLIFYQPAKAANQPGNGSYDTITYDSKDFTLIQGKTYYWQVTTDYGMAYTKKSTEIRTFTIDSTGIFYFTSTPKLNDVIAFNVYTGMQNALWYWNFGDGTSSNQQDISHRFTQSGLYDVCLTAKNTLNNFNNTVCSQVLIGNPISIADFSSTIIQTDSIAFKDLSNNKPVSWFWDFGDGSTSNLQNPSHKFYGIGLYTVCLVVKSSTGEQTKTCKQIQIGQNILSTDFTYFVDIATDIATFFVTSNDSIASYYWGFGDGSYSLIAKPIHKFAQGTWNVCLSVKSNKENYSQICKDVIIGNNKCLASFDYYINENTDSVYFNNSSKGSIQNSFWDFGNGNTSTLMNPIIKMKPGEYPVTLSVKGLGCLDNSTEQIIVRGSSCNDVTNFEYFVDMSTNDVTFLNETRSRTSKKYNWNFGDGTISIASNPVHKYDNAGQYTVSLTVSDSLGTCVKEISKNIQVGTIACNAQFSAYVENKKVTFVNSSIGNTTQLNWLFGDGTISNQLNPTHVYPAAGIYTARLYTYDSTATCMDYYEKQLVVDNIGNDCQSKFIFFSNLGSDSSIIFVNNSIGNSTVKYKWDFGDGVTATTLDSKHHFADSGYYSVCLTLIDTINGCFNTSCQMIKVGNTNKDCYTKYIYSIDSVSRKVRFSDVTIGQPTNWFWKFGTSTNDSSLAQNPTFKYTEDGYYPVRLKTITASGCMGEHLEVLSINGGDSLKCFYMIRPQKNLITSAKAILVKEGPYSRSLSNLEDNRMKSVDLAAATLGDASKFLWDFGDGTLDSTTMYPTHTYASFGTYTVCLYVEDPITGQSDQYCDEIILKDTASSINIRSYSAEGLGLENYPNPFNKTTTIQYVIPDDSKVSINIYNVFGLKVATLLNETKTAGEYKFVWNNSDLASGTYYLKLETEKGNLVKSVVIIE